MSNPTYAPSTFKPASPSATTSLLREIYEATPLYILLNALTATRR